MGETRRDEDGPHVVTLLGMCNDLLRRRWTVVGIVVVCAAGSALVRLAQPRTYTAVASFVPDAIQSPRGNDDIAPALGLLGGAGPARGLLDASAVRGGVPPALPSSAPPVMPLDPEFYWQLLRTREFLLTIVAGSFTIATPAGVRTGTAADLYGLAAKPAPRRAEDAARRLAREITVLDAGPSGILTLSVRTFDPMFARMLTERLLDALREQHRQMADVRTDAQVAFLTRAVSDARRDLTIAQDALARFLSANRAFEASSPLALEFRRHDADVVEKRRQYVYLATRLERARLDQSRAMQTISVVQRPETPATADPRGVMRATIIGTVGGIGLALLFVLIGEHIARLRAAGYHELSALEAEWIAAQRRGRARRTQPRTVAAVGPVSDEDGGGEDG